MSSSDRLNDWKKYRDESLSTNSFEKIPILENQKTLTHERTVLAILKKDLGWHLEKLPRRYVVDWARCEDKGGKVLSWVEYKHRSHTAKTFPSLMISTGKLVDGYKLSLYTDKPFILIVSFAGAEIPEHRVIYQCEITSDIIRQSDMRIGGRTDRGHDFDQEPVSYIPLKRFWPLNGYATREPLR